MNRLTETRTTLPLFAAAMLVATCLLPGCRPPVEEEVRLGYVGEFCGIDDDCRTDLVCNNSQCVDTGMTDPGACDTMCDRLVNECGRTEQNCASSCEKTIEGWSADAVMTFENCVLGMSTPELTCELARDSDAPSFCYAQIPLDETRQARCDGFINKSRDVAEPSNDQLTKLRQACYVLARTRPESVWANTEECIATDLTDDEFVKCMNKVFEVSPALTTAP